MNCKALYIPHGGGPLPLLGEPGHAELVQYLRELGQQLTPKAILLISAHWEEALPTVQVKPAPGLLFDYYGFPEQAYALEYPAPGEPALAAKVLAELETAGIEAQADAERDFDHGMFVPLMLMFPEANIPVVQVSLLASMDAEAHLRLGQAMAPLLDDVLLLGSGFSFHNMQAARSHDSNDLDAGNEAFEDWLAETMSEAVTAEQRWQRLADWAQAPSARYCHPREEHLLPLHVCYGAMQRAATSCTQLRVMGTRVSAYAW